MNKFIKFAGLTLAIVFVAFAAFGTNKASAATCVFTGSLTIGASGAEVTCLQEYLISAGYSIPAGATGYFGTQTQSAVAAWQTAHNVAPAAGYFGPLSQATYATLMSAMGSGSGSTTFSPGCTSAVGFSSTTGLPCTSVVTTYPAGCTSTAGFSPTTGMSCSSGMSALPAGCTSTSGFSPTTGASCSGGSTPNVVEGGAGDITLDDLSDFSGEEVGEDQEDAEVMAFNVEADDGSDVSIDSIKVEFYQDDTDSSQDFTDYAQSVSVWLDGEMVGEADAEDFSESSDYYSKSISLDGAIVDAGDDKDFTIAVTALSNLDSGDIDDDNWSVDLLSVRFTDGDGVTTTTDADTEKVDGSGTYEKDFDFASFASSADIDLKVSVDGDEDDINDTHIIDVDTGDDTENVEVLAFTLEAEGDSDITLNDLPITITTTGETDESAIVINAHLLRDGEEIASEDVPSGGAVTFEDLDEVIDAGDTAKFSIAVDLQDTDGALDNGDTVMAAITSTNADAIDADDETGEQLSDSETSGAATGNAHTVLDKGIMVTFVDSSYVKTSSDTSGINETVEFTLEFDVTAFDGDAYVESSCIDNATPSASHTTDVVVSLDGDANGDNTSCTDINSTGDEGTGFEVLEGQTETFTVTILGNGGEAGGAGTSVTFTARLESIGYKMNSDAAGDTQYAVNLADFHSDAVTVFDR